MASYYDLYKHLLGVPYDDGVDDCYELWRKYYRDLYALELSNYARSADFFGEGINPLHRLLLEEGFAVVDVSMNRLEVGDGLLISVPILGQKHIRGDVNHLGIYVGNNTFIHHLFGEKSKEDGFDVKWKSRVTSVARHPQVIARNAEPKSYTKLTDLLPDHVKRRYGIESS